MINGKKELKQWYYFWARETEEEGHAFAFLKVEAISSDTMTKKGEFPSLRSLNDMHVHVT